MKSAGAGRTRAAHVPPAHGGLRRRGDRRRRRPHRHVRPRLVYHADHSERDAHSADIDTRRHALHIRYLANGIGQCGNLRETLLQHIELSWCDSETIEQGGLESVLSAVLQILLIGS